MEDGDIQVNVKSVPMTEQQWWLVKYALLVKSELGKRFLNAKISKGEYYIFHVKLDSGNLITVLMMKILAGWHCEARLFGAGIPLGQDGVFFALR